MLHYIFPVSPVSTVSRLRRHVTGESCHCRDTDCKYCDPTAAACIHQSVVVTSRPRYPGTMSREAADLCYLCPAPATAHCPACGLGYCCAEHGDLHRDPASNTCHPFTVQYTDNVGR